MLLPIICTKFFSPKLSYEKYGYKKHKRETANIHAVLEFVNKRDAEYEIKIKISRSSVSYFFK